MGEKKSISTFLWVLLILILAGIGLYLLYPVYRDLRDKQNTLQKKEAELHELRKQQNFKQQQNHELRTSPAAVERVAREEFKMVRKGESVVYYSKDAEKNWNERRQNEQK